jgi:hypothetical protein
MLKKLSINIIFFSIILSILFKFDVNHNKKLSQN